MSRAQNDSKVRITVDLSAAQYEALRKLAADEARRTHSHAVPLASIVRSLIENTHSRGPAPSKHPNGKTSQAQRDRIVELRNGGMTFTQIAAELNGIITEGRVRQIYNASKGKTS